MANTDPTWIVAANGALMWVIVGLNLAKIRRNKVDHVEACASACFTGNSKLTSAQAVQSTPGSRKDRQAAEADDREAPAGERNNADALDMKLHDDFSLHVHCPA